MLNISDFFFALKLVAATVVVAVLIGLVLYHLNKRRPIPPRVHAFLPGASNPTAQQNQPEAHSDNSASLQLFKERLAQLPKYLPNQPAMVYDLARYLGERLPASFLPVTFVLDVMLLLEDLRKGASSVPGHPIPHELRDLKPETLRVLSEPNFPMTFAKDVCPPEFREDVDACCDWIEDSGQLSASEPQQ